MDVAMLLGKRLAGSNQHKDSWSWQPTRCKSESRSRRRVGRRKAKTRKTVRSELYFNFVLAIILIINEQRPHPVTCYRRRPRTGKTKIRVVLA